MDAALLTFEKSKKRGGSIMLQWHCVFKKTKIFVVTLMPQSHVIYTLPVKRMCMLLYRVKVKKRERGMIYCGSN